MLPDYILATSIQYTFQLIKVTCNIQADTCAEQILELCWKKLKILLEVLLGHCTLNKYLHILEIETDPNYSWHKTEKEMKNHVMRCYPSMKKERSKYSSGAKRKETQILNPFT